MTARSKASPRLPAGLSPEEKARYRDERRDHLNSLDARTQRLIPPRVERTKPINIRLPVDLLEALRQEAAHRGLPYQTLIRIWLTERLDAETRQRDA